MINLISIILLIILLFIGYKYFESFWSPQFLRPFSWDEALKQGKISKDLQKLEKIATDKVRFYNLWFIINQLKNNNIPGSFAELGVYKGETAKIIHLIDNARTFHLFDTFEGFNTNDLEQEKISDDRYSTTNFADTSLDKVKIYINGNNNISYHQGRFPQTLTNIIPQTFAFVHIDADLYLPTFEALNFFFPYLASGGIILIHDYNHNWDGVKKAVDLFLLNNPCATIQLADAQGSIALIK